MKIQQNKPVCTVITGASTGLGKELAVAFARRHQNLVLVALPGRNLNLLCRELETLYRIRAFAFEYDLTDEDALDQLVVSILKECSVNRLVNNAGTGGTKRFTEASCEYLDRIIQLNIRATTMLTRQLLPELLKHDKALIVNVASMAAFGPIPYKTVYPASKAFIYSFSRSLNRELKGTGVSVIVVNPGQIITNPITALRIFTQGMLGRCGLLSCSQITEQIMKAIETGQDVVIPGTLNKFNRFLIRSLPEKLRLNFLEKTYRKELFIKNILD